jgi:hypothetical protein
MPRLDRDEQIVGKGFRVRIIECSRDLYEKHLRHLGFVFSNGASVLETTEGSAYRRARETIVALGLDSVRTEARRKPTHAHAAPRSESSHKTSKADPRLMTRSGPIIEQTTHDSHRMTIRSQLESVFLAGFVMVHAELVTVN